MTVKFTNLSQFNKDLKRFIHQIDVDSNQAVRKIAIDLFAGVTQRTPVDTGHARASWHLAVGQPDLRDESRGSGGEAAAQASNDQQISNFESEVDIPVVFITNNLPYIIPLEQGHSKQSEKGFMVQRTLNDVTQNISDIVREI